MCTEIRIGVAVDDALFCYIYNTELTLRENIEDIIRTYNDDYESIKKDLNLVYDLKLISGVKSTCTEIIEHYITENSIERDIKDGYTLKLVESVQDTACKLCEPDTINNEELLKVSSDPVFIDAIVNNHRQDALIRLLKEHRFDETGESGALNVLYQVLYRGYIHQFENNFVEQLVQLAQSDLTSSTFAISLMVLIITTKKESLNANKDIIMKTITVDLLLKNFDERKTAETGLYQKIFRLMNSLISCAKAEKRAGILLELNTASNREILHRFMIKPDNVDDYIARELFILQARLLTHTYIGYYSNRSSIISIASSSLYEESTKRMSAISEDYDYVGWSRQEQDAAWMEGSMKKAESMFSVTSEVSLSKLPGSALLTKCLEYGRKNYSTYFQSLEKTDYASDAELYNIAQNIVSMITNLLCIGVKVHAHNYYLPVYFAKNEMQGELRDVGFFEELFVRTLMMLFHTKAQMRVRTKEDFKKLYPVLNKQLKLVFAKRPRDFKEWDMISKNITYEHVQANLDMERVTNWQRMYRTNECVKQLAEQFAVTNEQHAIARRLEILRRGHNFPDMSRSKPDRHLAEKPLFALALMPDNKHLLYNEHATQGKKIVIPLYDIRHIVVGEACRLIKDNIVSAIQKDCVFSIEYALNQERFSIDCYIENDEYLAGAWKDGLNLLHGTADDKFTKHPSFREEIDMLSELDCCVHLIELQGVDIPREPPAVPKFTPLLNAYETFK